MTSFPDSRHPFRNVLITGVLLAWALTACDSEPSIEERLRGQWKNGDGNLIGFAEDGVGSIGQEGLSGSGDCRYELRGDTVIVTVPMDGAADAAVIYAMGFDGDTLRIRTIERVEGGASMRLTVEQYAAQMGRPLYKLDFLKEDNVEKVTP